MDRQDIPGLDWLTLEGRRLEGPGLHRAHGGFGESHGQAPEDPDIADPPLRINGRLHNHRPIKTGVTASFYGYLGVDLREDLRPLDIATDAQRHIRIETKQAFVEV